YPSYAAYVLSDNMAETPERVYGLLDQIWEPAIETAIRDRADFEQMMVADGLEPDLEAWDWRYYAEKVRKARYDLDEEILRPYFEVNAARDGVFEVANRLYGVTFTERPDLPRWNPEQQVFEVREADGTHVGILYMDFFMRDNKRGGAWMNSLRSQSRFDGEVTPIVTTNFNFPPPTGDTPSLLSFGDVETLAHEMGHALHGLFSDVTYRSLSGTSVDRDFVELGSQIMENWMGQPEVLRLYARHFVTGEPIPEELVVKLDNASKFDQGFATVEYLAASYLDMAWHTLEEPVGLEPAEFEAAEMERIGLIDEIIPRYRNTYFAHIFSGGYSAGYYAYIWAEVLDADAFDAFLETSLFDQETATRFRREVLSKGGTRPGMELYVAFRGREPSIEPLLERRGLSGAD
ncbi:MAG: M3 family metallopeptidase, partial [Gemmatimonadota bacterium]